MSRFASTLAPFKHRIFLKIWLANTVSNVGGHIQTVAAAWLMTSLTSSADLIALVHTASTLPVLLLALLAGAVADLFNRRVVMLLAQLTMLTAATVLAVITYLDQVDPTSLLVLTLLLGCGRAFNGPAWQASVGEQVSREHLPGAVMLNSMGFNLARTLGPAAGGLIIAASGPPAAFLVNALTYVGLLVVLANWRAPKQVRDLPPETLKSAISAGISFAWLSPTIQSVLVRALAFGAASSALLALVPVVVREALGLGAASYGLMMGAFGLGAVAAALLSGRIRRSANDEVVVAIAVLGMAASIFVIATSSWLAVALASMAVAGGCWVMVLSTYNVTVQMSAPRWVLGRALSLFQMANFGGMAIGSWLWGHCAESFGLQAALTLSSLTVMANLLLAFKWKLDAAGSLDLAPARRGRDPHLATDLNPRAGPVVTWVEYRVREADARAFMAAMEAKRRIRRRDGGRRWTLLQDLADPEIWIERFESATWTERLRLRHRVTRADEAVEQRVRSFHFGGSPIKVRLLLVRPAGSEPVSRDRPAPYDGGVHQDT
ncbi:MFS transporter [Pacificimonas sp. ICDLI1SI03]